MDGYRQTLLGRALADALQDLEKERGDHNDLEVDGDLLFSLFDESMELELRDSGQEGRTFTHESLELTGKVTAFNRFLGDWSVQARVMPRDIKLDHCVADLQLPQQQNHEREEDQNVAMRLKLRQRT
ncbi:hypothetical protein PRNP1_004277 [Phytophthora ramorum]